MDVQPVNGVSNTFLDTIKENIRQLSQLQIKTIGIVSVIFLVLIPYSIYRYYKAKKVSVRPPSPNPPSPNPQPPTPPNPVNPSPSEPPTTPTPPPEPTTNPTPPPPEPKKEPRRPLPPPRPPEQPKVPEPLIIGQFTFNGEYRDTVMKKGRLTFQNKVLELDGEFRIVNDELVGKGKITYANGNVFKGSLQGTLIKSGTFTTVQPTDNLGIYQSYFAPIEEALTSLVFTFELGKGEFHIRGAAFSGTGPVKIETIGPINAETGQPTMETFATYNGQIEDGLPNGQGDLTIGRAPTYENPWTRTYAKGIFRQGLLNDPNGEYQTPNETVYRGNIVNNQLTGEGSITYYRGNIRLELGMFDRDELVTGSQELRDGSRYENLEGGRFRDGYLEGPGRLKRSDGSTIEGRFRWGYFGEKVTNDDESETKIESYVGEGKLINADGTETNGLFKLKSRLIPKLESNT